MLKETLVLLFDRDLKKLKVELESYSNEADLWLLEKSITNSAGNLCLHLIGNLNWFIGAQLGDTGYVRDRPLEFSAKHVPRVDMLSDIDKTLSMIETTILKLTNEQLEADYPRLVFKEKTSTYFFLIHLATHLAYHLGQINYHRRLLNG